MNETPAFHGRKLKHEGHIFSSYTKNGVVFIKNFERSKPIKVPSFKTCEFVKFANLSLVKIFVLFLVKL